MRLGTSGMHTRNINHAQLNKSLLTISLLGLLLYFGKSFLVPVAIAAFFAMLLYPLVHRLQRRKVKKPLAAFLSILLLLAVLVALGTVVYYQLRSLDADLPRLELKVTEKSRRIQDFLYQATDLSANEQDQIIEEKKPDIAKAVFKSIKQLLVQGLSVLLFLFIVLSYTFFFLLYQHKLHTFFVRVRWFQSQRASRVMMTRISRIVHDYLKGTFLVIMLLSVIYALGFRAIGIEHAILFALVTALLRLVPYFGSFLGIVFPIVFALLTKDSFWYPVLVLLFFMATQLLEANLLTPYITGSKVKLNPLATIMAILLGNLVWGVPGMILFLPLFAILKVIFDQIPQLEPYGYLLGKEE
ncbi:hypothetical protein DP923_05955 [Pontibacter arcticus]|uniref:AI-2E family transporter n=2 Tax=Pontibacter arcticus TaxID=2080288 RepID=A0A364REW6_9BACT|nr:hypothetical protein DP923_05955 [Pontibacter arcticus]